MASMPWASPTDEAFRGQSLRVFGVACACYFFYRWIEDMPELTAKVRNGSFPDYGRCALCAYIQHYVMQASFIRPVIFAAELFDALHVCADCTTSWHPHDVRAD